MKRTLYASLKLLFVYLAFSAPLSATWHEVGSLAVTSHNADQIVFSSSEASVTLIFLAPDLVRVRMTRGMPGPDDSYAVIKTQWPKVEVDFSGDKHESILRTSQLEVRAQLDPFRLAFYDRGGRLISRDDSDLGMGWDGRRVRCWKWLPQDEHYFGLGEKGDHLDKRGHAYVNWNTDAFGWDEATDPLYDTIPFFIGLRDGRAYGIFFDNTWRSSFDMGVESPGRYSFGAEGGEMNYYFFYGPDPKKVIERYTELVGRMPLPARWAIAYHQSRYSYYPEKRVRFIADAFRQFHIPCDALFLDIHYMDGYRVFTWDKSRFPDPAGMLSDLRKEGFRVVTIVDPGVKVDPNYWVYQQGMEGGDFVKMPDGRVFIGKVWPGDSAWPDFTSEKVRSWWGTLFKGLVSDGVAGIWNDMNEPAVFSPSKTMPLDAVFYDNGLHSPQEKVHNVYGMEMSRATREGLLQLRPNERPLVITRATYAGGQRYAAVWTGDNSSTWDHLRISIPELMNMGLSGLTLVGADIGGFALSCTPELYTRWLEAGVFYPYARTHTMLGSRNQEPWSFGNRMTDINRHSIDLRYQLLPYLYNAFHESSETGLPVMRALLLDYPDDPQAVAQDGEFLFGDDFLVAPVTKQGESRWDVYLPKGIWYDYWTDHETMGPAELTIDAPLDRIPLFVRGGAIFPSQQVVQYTDEEPINPLTFEIYPGDNSTTKYYEDDGVSFKYRRGQFLTEEVTFSNNAKWETVDISARKGSYVPPTRSIVIEIHAQHHRPASVRVNGQQLLISPTEEAFGRESRSWIYDENRKILYIRMPDERAGLTIQIAT